MKTKLMPPLKISWNEKHNAQLITRYISTLCRKYPKIAKMVLRNGIGDLNHWFSNSRGRAIEEISKAKCGCMVGTTALIAMKADPTVCNLVLKNSETAFVKDDAAELLYRFILAKTGRYVPEEEAYTRTDEKLYDCINDAGMAASKETVVLWGTGIYPLRDELSDRQRKIYEKMRHKEVLDHIEFMFKKKLGMVRTVRRTA